MTDEVRAELERVWDELAMLRVTPLTPATAEEARKQRIERLAAARRKWRNEALEEAAQGPSGCICSNCQAWREWIHGLKE